ncbi:MAG: FAD-binding oxidoreductase [Actinomycetota bacterium]|nr:FAD-binding oxidoreductase [Actinomycetota bacterium]
MRGRDVIVVGGGVVGCACARELALRGLRVTLVERSDLAAGASGRNHGLLLTPTDPALVPMATAALEAYRDVAEHQPDLVRIASEPMGFLIVASSDADAERVPAEAEADAAAACGVQVEHLVGQDLRRAEPGLGPDYAEGWLLRDGRLVDPASLTVAMALAAREAGAEILRNLPVRSLLVRGDAVRGVIADEGPIEADHVVVAAGPWTGSLLRPLGIHLPVTPARGFLVHLGPAPALLRHVVETGGWHPLPGQDPMPGVLAGVAAAAPSEPFFGTLMQQNPDGTVLAGSSREAALGAEPEDPSVPREILRRAIRLVPALEGVRVIGSWWGVRPMTPDARPIVGRLREGLTVATGHGGQGVILAGGTAPLVAALVLGREPPFPSEPFGPSRFDPPGPG